MLLEEFWSWLLGNPIWKTTMLTVSHWGRKVVRQPYDLCLESLCLLVARIGMRAFYCPDRSYWKEWNILLFFFFPKRFAERVFFFILVRNFQFLTKFAHLIDGPITYTKDSFWLYSGVNKAYEKSKLLLPLLSVITPLEEFTIIIRVTTCTAIVSTVFFHQ